MIELKKIATSIKVAKGFESEDFIHDTLTYQMEAFLKTTIRQNQQITVFRPKQKFWDWIRGRHQMFTLQFRVYHVKHVIGSGESYLFELKEVTLGNDTFCFK